MTFKKGLEMSEIEFIDLFSENAETPNETAETTNSFEGNPFYSQTRDGNPEGVSINQGRSRMKVNDYKHQAPHLSKGNQRVNSVVQDQVSSPLSEKGKTSGMFNMNDEKMVWAGALFVFFGVFVFIFGYWLGNTTVAKIKVDHSRYERQIKQRLEEKKIENQALTPMVAPQENKNNIDRTETETETETATSIPMVKPNDTVEKNIPIEKVITPRQIEPKVKSTTTTTHKVTKVIATTPVKTHKSKTRSAIAPKPGSASNKGNYTLQVSAYTQMDKARALEDILRNKGLQAYIVESMVNGTRYFRVRVGKYNGKSDASAALQKLKANTIAKNSYLIRLK